jgi:hypothetical protein
MIQSGWRRPIRCRAVQPARADSSCAHDARLSSAAESATPPGRIKSAPATENPSCHALSKASYRAIYNSMDTLASWGSAQRRLLDSRAGSGNNTADAATSPRALSKGRRARLSASSVRNANNSSASATCRQRRRLRGLETPQGRSCKRSRGIADSHDVSRDLAHRVAGR